MPKQTRERFDQQTNIMLTKTQRARLAAVAEERAAQSSSETNVSATARLLLLLGMDVYEAQQQGE
jgi:hypothetical protein